MTFTPRPGCKCARCLWAHGDKITLPQCPTCGATDCAGAQTGLQVREMPVGSRGQDHAPPMPYMRRH
nr:MAG TPA: zinc-ribbon protein [Caudoviricetes sp.]DAH72454.1 MAG TPA: zinc-ribbon protein [Caudoviricetes sp.]